MKTLRFFLTIVLGSIWGHILAQAPDAIWARNEAQSASHLDSDSHSIFVGGYFAGQTVFDSVLLNGNGIDPFVAKYDYNGNLHWVTTGNSESNDYISDVVADGKGNCYAILSHWREMSIGNTIIDSSRSGSIVVKLDSSGNVCWWSKFEGGGIEGLAIDGNGNCYFTGSFRDSLIFLDQSLYSEERVGILVKMNKLGEHRWTQTFGLGFPLTSHFVTPEAIDVSPSGLIAIAGSFSGEVILGTNSWKSVNNSVDLFLMTYDTNGIFQKVIVGGGLEGDDLTGVSIGKFGDIVATGSVSDSFLLGSHLLRTSGGVDIYVLSLDDHFEKNWHRTFGGPDQDFATGIVQDDSGAVYVAGSFQGPATFGSFNINSLGSYDAVFAAINRTGDVSWVQSGGGFNEDHGKDLVLGPRNELIVCGGFNEFLSLSNIQLSASNAWDFFLIKFAAEQYVDVLSPSTEFEGCQFLLYPNPASHEIHLRATQCKEIGSPSDLEIYDILGNLMFSKSCFIRSQRQFDINIESFPVGIYTMKVKFRSSTMERKFVKTGY